MDLLFFLIAVGAFLYAFVCFAAVRENMDPNEPLSVVAIGKYGLNKDGRRYLRRFFVALIVGAIMVLLTFIYGAVVGERTAPAESSSASVTR